MRGADRVKGVTESVIREMTRKAIKYDAINLSQGYPDYPTSPEVLGEAKKAIEGGENQYSVTWGIKELREKISEKLEAFNDLTYDPEMEVTVTSGSSGSIMSSVLGLVDSGEEVLLFQPFYENYVPSVNLASAEPMFTDINRDLEIDREDIKEKVGNNTRAMILNTPHNPTGKIFDKEELKFIRDLCIDNDILIFTDEMYERMVYEGEHISPASLDGMRERTVSIGGFSKVYSITGWRIGYSAAPEELMKPIRKVHDYTTICAPKPFQKGSVKALDLPVSYYDEMLEYYRERRDYLYENLSGTRLDPWYPHGAYYMMAEIDDYEMNDKEFADYLVEERGVAVVPGSSFYSNGGEDLVRFCFSKDMDSLEEAVENIKED